MQYLQELKIAELCKKRIIIPKPFYFYKTNTQGTWLFHVKDELTLSVVCPKSNINHFDYQTEVINLKKSAYLSLARKCSTPSQGIILLFHFRSKTKYTVILLNIRVPDWKVLLAIKVTM